MNPNSQARHNEALLGGYQNLSPQLVDSTLREAIFRLARLRDGNARLKEAARLARYGDDWEEWAQWAKEEIDSLNADVERLTCELDSAMQLLERLAPGAIRNPLVPTTNGPKCGCERVAAEREWRDKWMPDKSATREGGA